MKCLANTMKQEDATFPRKIHQFVTVAYFIQAGLLVMKKLFLLLGLHFASISPADSEPLKDPSLGLHSSPWSHRNCQAAISASLFSVLPIAVSPSTILHFCHFDSH